VERPESNQSLQPLPPPSAQLQLLQALICIASASQTHWRKHAHTPTHKRAHSHLELLQLALALLLPRPRLRRRLLLRLTLLAGLRLHDRREWGGRTREMGSGSQVVHRKNLQGPGRELAATRSRDGGQHGNAAPKPCASRCPIRL
jgi:hypothetical protein